MRIRLGSPLILKLICGSVLLTSILHAEEEKGDTEVIPVTGSRLQKTDADDLSKIEIPREEAELIAPSGDVAQVPKILPGTFARPQDSQVAIRGSDRRESIYLIDNLQAPNLFEPISGTSVIPSRAIANLQFIPGNFDSQYGDSTGGVIRLETRGADIFEPYSEFRLNLPIYISGYHEQSLGDNSSIILSARKSTLEPFVRNFVQEEGLFLVPYFQDVYLQHAYYSGDWSIKSRFLHSLSGAEINVYTDRSTTAEGTAQFNFETGYNLLGVDIQRRFTDLTLRFDPYVSQSSTEFTTNDVFFEIDATSFVVPLRSQLRVNNDLNIFLGMETRFTDFDLSALVPDTVGQGPFRDPENAERRRLSVDSTLRHDAAWASVEFGIENLLVTPSVRVFRQTNLKESGADPRLTARYRLGIADTLKFGVGQYSAAPLPQELDPGFGNPDLPWIRSLHYTAGWETLFADFWSSDVQIFYKDWDNLVLEDTIRRFVPETTRSSQGLEWFLRYSDQGRWFGWLAYTYSESRELRSDIGKEVPTENDATHILHMVGNYKINDRWQIGSRLKHQTGYVYTPISTVFYQANTDTYQPSSDPLLTNSQRVPDTTSFSLFAQMESAFDQWTLITRFGVEEYQFRDSSPNIQYNYNYTKKDYTTGLPVIPFIELRAVL
ncbi:MAG: TonB-dependent receptor plug domain-containing protein [Oligoflexus sp.]